VEEREIEREGERGRERERGMDGGWVVDDTYLDEMRWWRRR
jgi:hypothetical protein